MTTGRQRRPTLAILGAGGLVGSITVSMLSLRHFHWGEVRLVGSPRSTGRSMPVRGRRQPIEPSSVEVFQGVDVAVFATPAVAAGEWIQIALDAGALVVDGSGATVDDPQVPVLVPSVNAHAAAERRHRLVAVPGGMTSTLSEVLAAIHGQWGLENVVVSTYEPASAAGISGVDRLRDELDAVVADMHTDGWVGQRPGGVRGGLAARLGDHPSPFPAPLALNVIPMVGQPLGGGWSSDELTLQSELQRVLGIRDLTVSATRVLVPVLIGHCASVHTRTQQRAKVARVRQAFVEAPGIVVLDDPASGDFPMPVDVAGVDPVFVGRLRQDPGSENGVSFFLCGDNVRRGTGLALLKVAELMASRLDP